MLVILGAGASDTFGIPTTQPFAQKVRQRISSSSPDKSTDDKITLIEFIEKGLADFPLQFDLEVLMTVLTDLSKEETNLISTISPYTSFLLTSGKMGRSIDSQIRSIAHDLLVNIKEIVRHECLAPLKPLNEKILPTFDFLMNELVEGVKDGKHTSGDGHVQYPSNLKVYTTNYDTTFETYLGIRNIPFNKGIVNRYGSYVFDIQEFQRQDPSTIRLVKFHGSLDLFWTTDGFIVQLQSPKVKLNEITDEVTTFGKRLKEEFMVYPTETGGYNYVALSPFSDMLQMLRSDARDDPHWIIIGSSLRDTIIASMLNDLLRVMQLSRRSYQKVVIQDMKPDKTQENLRFRGFDSLADAAVPLPAAFGEREGLRLKDLLLESTQ